MHADESFDFLAADLLAAAIDVVAQPPLVEGVIGLALDHAGGHHVAGAVKAVAGKCALVGVRRIEEPAQARRAAEAQFAGFAEPHLLSEPSSSSRISSCAQPERTWV